MFGTSPTSSGPIAAFVFRAGFLDERAGSVALSAWTQRWRTTGRAEIVAALLHSRVRFVGEMLAEATEPRTTGELLAVANQRYGMTWTTQGQIDRRRGWLQSAGMLSVDESQRIVTTELGRALLARLDLHPPRAIGAQPEQTQAVVPTEPSAVEVSAEPGPAAPSVVGSLAAELVASSTDSTNPDRFERAVRDAFAFLGFEAEWLGGAGKTDVLVDAPLGGGRDYRVIVDCKTSASGHVGDQQVDWITLGEHRRKHDADHVALVAPTPTGKRLFERAGEQGVTVVSVDQLVTLCGQHAGAPLGLDAYRSLFSAPGAVQPEAVGDAAETWVRTIDLTRVVLDTIRLRSTKVGPLTARDLYLVLADTPDRDSTEIELQSVLDALASPLLGLVDGTPNGGYLVIASPSVVAARLRVMATRLGVDDS